MRLAASPSKRQFLLDVMNVFDVLAIVPYFVVLVVQQTEGNCEAAKRSGTFIIIRVLRIFRIFKLSKHSQVQSTDVLRPSIAYSYEIVSSHILSSSCVCSQRCFTNPVHFSENYDFWLSLRQMKEIE